MDRPNGVIGRRQGRYGGQEVTKEKFRVIGNGVSSGTGQSGSGSGRVGCLLRTDKLIFFHLVRSSLVNL